MAEIYQIPETGSNNANAGGIPFSIPIGGNNGGLFYRRERDSRGRYM